MNLSDFVHTFDWQKEYQILWKKGLNTGYLFSQIKGFSNNQLLMICESDKEAFQLYNDAIFFGVNAYFFQSIELIPYSKMPIQPEVLGVRMSTLYNLAEKKPGLYITSLQALLEPVIPMDVMKENYVYLLRGEDFPFTALIQSLIMLGYERVESVELQCEFSVKGGIVDLFSPYYQHPLRIEFFGDTIENIKFFNLETQRSIANTEECIILPAKNFIFKEKYVTDALNHIKQYGDRKGISKKLREQISENILNKIYFPGIEFFLPVLYGQKYTLSTYLPSIKVILYQPERFQKVWAEKKDNIFKAYNYHIERGEFIVAPDDLYDFESYDLLNKKSLLSFCLFSDDESKIVLDFDENGDIEEKRLKLKDAVSNGKLGLHPIEILKEVINENRQIFKILIVASKRHQCKKLKDLLNVHEIAHNGIVEDFKDFLKMAHPGNIFLTYGKPLYGFKNFSTRLFLITEEEIFGMKEKRKEQRKKSLSESISTIYELKENDLAVHVDHGIGIFRGLKQVSVLGKIGEYIELEYADNAKLFVPVEKINLIQKYIASEDYVAKIDRLGEKRWQKAKKKAKEDLRKWAEEIIKLEALRRTKEGYAFQINVANLEEFSATFDYEETEDQKKAIEDVISDMEQKKPMDRIVCGDVGFGKTEVAVRAAFIVVENKKQVAIIAPTTILVEQHFDVFSKRFQPFGYRVDMISRFVDEKRQKKIIEDLKNGDIDIIIGTHRLLSKNIAFKDLGLVVIDEEHKFGVAHKEKLKNLKAEVDVLTLTATPIPRTMHMSLSGLKEISIIASPPEGRLSTKTFVTRFSSELIREAVEREIQRGGQVFFIHNKIQSIYTMEKYLKKLFPYIDITVAHGRMDEFELKKVMEHFKKGDGQILLTTTIVESGLDIPNANTIIVNRADKFGLADLYQLRGRVGRSTRRAYAYFLIPSFESITKEAQKRLKAIQELEELGTGFKLAIHDLEIRGAGDLLGKRQSGHINEIGLELYTQLLEETIRELRYESGEKEHKKRVEAEINLPFAAYIPESYINSPRERLDFYKRIFAVKEVKTLELLEEELFDRFGRLPEEIKNFIYQKFLEITMSDIGVMRLYYQNGNIIIVFDNDFIPPKDVILGMAKKKLNIKYVPPEKIYITLPTKTVDVSEIKKVLHVFIESVKMN